MERQYQEPAVFGNQWGCEEIPCYAGPRRRVSMFVPCEFHTYIEEGRSRTDRDEECVLERSPLLENARKHASSRGPLSSVSNVKGWLGRSQSESEIACLEWSDEWETTSLEFTSFSLQTLFETIFTTEVQVAKAGRGLISRCVLRLVKQGWRGGDGESL
jgi:hypothetical protein